MDFSGICWASGFEGAHQKGGKPKTKERRARSASQHALLEGEYVSVFWSSVFVVSVVVHFTFFLMLSLVQLTLSSIFTTWFNIHIRGMFVLCECFCSSLRVYSVGLNRSQHRICRRSVRGEGTVGSARGRNGMAHRT